MTRVTQARRHGAQRVLLVADSLAVGGAERHVASLAAALQRRGHIVSVACSTGGPLAQELLAAGVATDIMGDSVVKRRADPRYVDWLRGVVARHRPDVVHAHMHASSIAAAGAVAGSDVALVITEHSEATWRQQGAWDEAAAACAAARAVIAVSQAIACRLIAVAGLDPSRLHLVHNSLPSQQSGGKTLRRRIGCRLQVGVVSRLLPEKGVDVFLEAAALITAALPDSCFLIVGDGPERPSLERQAERLGIRSRVGFLGQRQDTASIMRRLDVLCVPSRSEGTPLVVLEAMAVGTPLVATTVGGIPEQVRDGREALLVAVDDAPAMAAATLRLLRQRLLRLRLTYAARRRVRRQFSSDRMVSSIERVYRGCQQLPATPVVEEEPVQALASR